MLYKKYIIGTYKAYNIVYRNMYKAINFINL